MTGKACLGFIGGLWLIAGPVMGGPTLSSILVTDCGARGDGQADDTAAIRKALTTCARAGGGKVVIPPGTFISGPLELADRVELHLASGAVLEASKDLDDYTIDAQKRGLIYATDAENVAVTGLGILQGNGTHFMTDTPKPLENSTGRYTRQGESYQAGKADGPMKMGPRPGSLIHFSRCRQVTIQDVTIKDAPEWTIRLSECDGAQLRGVSILNNPLIPNNDGIHCVTSRNIRISDCDVRAGDDAIAITGLYGTPGAVTENITVSNCTLRSRSSGVRVGYGANAMRRCTFENLVIHESNRGIGVFVREEGSVSDILFSNIIIHTRLHTGDWWGNGEPIHVSCIPSKPGVELGQIENVRFSNILADGEHGIVVYGVQDRPIRNLAFENVSLKIRPSPLNERFGGNFDLRPAYDDQHTLFGHDIPGLYARHVRGMKIDGFKLAWGDALPAFFTHGIACVEFNDLNVEGFEGRQALPDTNQAAIALRRGHGVKIQNCRALPGTATFLAQTDIEGPRVLAHNDLTFVRRVMEPESPSWLLKGNLLPSRPPRK